MKIARVFVLLAAALPAIAWAQTKEASPIDPETEKAVIKLEHDLSAALTKPDADAVEALLADEFYLVTPDGATATKEDFVDDVESGDLKLESNKLSDMKVRAATPEMAVVTYRSTDKGTSNGKDISGQCLWTDVLVKRDGQWQVLTGQGTALAEPEP